MARVSDTERHTARCARRNVLLTHADSGVVLHYLGAAGATQPGIEPHPPKPPNLRAVMPSTEAWSCTTLEPQERPNQDRATPAKASQACAP